MYQSLASLMWEQADSRADQFLYRFTEDTVAKSTALTYGEFAESVQQLAGYLQSINHNQSPMLLLYPPGLEYVRAFFACVAAGIVAVPAYPPNPAALQKSLPRLLSIIEDSTSQHVLTTSAIAGMATFLFQQAPGLQACQWHATDEVDSAQPFTQPNLTQDTLAFLQYTSGSTGTPKGVMLTHGNLLFNSELIKTGFAHDESLRGVIWLPPYHDMGLIGGVIQPMYCGGSVTLMSPLSFLKKPLRWLQAISDTKATTSGGPNFAYDLVVRKTTPEQRAALDLSSWKVAFNGAEPIRPKTLDAFTDAFGPSGFQRSAFYPCYGLAEATLIVSGGIATEEPIQTPVDTAALAKGTAQHDPAGSVLTSSGRTFDQQQLAIVDATSCERLADNRVGEIWVSGPGVAQGYWQQPTRSEATFHATIAGSDSPQWLRTGDLGFMQNGELYVTGRIKDLIIIRGRNIYPQDVERTVEEAHSAVRPGCVAAFAVEQDGGEALVIVCEARRDMADADATIVAVQRELAASHDLKAKAIVLVKAGSIAKTSSGKIQRFACRDAFLADTLSVVAQSKQAVPAAAAQSIILQTLSALPDRATKVTILDHYVAEQLEKKATSAEFPPTIINDLNCTAPEGWDRCTTAQLAALLLRQLDGVPELQPRDSIVVPFSAETSAALDQQQASVRHYLQTHPAAKLGDIAFTQFSSAQASNGLRQVALAAQKQGIGDASAPLAPSERPVAFLLPGIGDQYGNIARGLYDTESVFRASFDRCADLLYPSLNVWLDDLLFTEVAEKPADGGVNLRAMLGRGDSRNSQQDTPLHQTKIAHPLVFAIDYAVAQQLMAWGIRPNALLGYSLGEYVAACLAGVLSLEDALHLVATRAALIETLPHGSMLAVSAAREVVDGLVSAEISLAAHNSDGVSVLSGPSDAIDALAEKLTAERVANRKLSTTHPFHSELLRPIAPTLSAEAAKIALSPPRIPIVSNVTGDWLTDADAIDPDYWVRHLCGTVEFARGLQTLLAGGEKLLIEVGPGQSLGSFAKQNAACSPSQMGWILPTLRYSYLNQNDGEFLMDTVGKVWVSGVDLDATALFAGKAVTQLDFAPVQAEAERLGSTVSRGEQRRAKLRRRKARGGG